VFESGYDFFNELPEIGIETDAYSRPDRTAALDAWRRLGRMYLDERCTADQDVWALAEFGEPEAA